jgi:ATP-dependent helicase HepA
VPADLEPLTEEVVRRAAARFGFGVERGRGRRAWLIELGYEALVEQLPGVPPGSRFLGTFDREEAVADESLDFFAAGHPLVEGVLSELEDGSRGRVALLQVPGEEEVFGLLALYRRGEELAAVAVDRAGRQRPDLAERLTAPGLATEVVETARWTGQPGWAATVHRLAAALPPGEVPQAVAAFRVRRTSSGRALK